MTEARHLVLIGLMGAGKTTVGERCAATLGRGFVDTDALVEANAGRSVAEVFAAEGEAAFRARERAALVEALASPEPLVVACGGGAMVDPDNRRAARVDGYVVWLRGDPVELAARVERDGTDTRPLLAGGPTVATLTRLADARSGAYAAAAHTTVETGGLSVGEVATAVLAAYTGLA